MSFIEGLRGRRENPIPQQIVDSREALLARSVLDEARETARDIRIYFTERPYGLKIDTMASHIIEYFITKQHASIPDGESPEASQLIKRELQQKYKDLFEREVRRTHPKRKSKIILVHQYLRQATIIMDENYLLDLSFPEEEEVRKQAQELINKYAAKMGSPGRGPKVTAAGLFSLAATAAAVCAGGMAINTAIKTMGEQNPASGSQVSMTSPDATKTATVATPYPVALSGTSGTLWITRNPSLDK